MMRKIQLQITLMMQIKSNKISVYLRSSAAKLIHLFRAIWYNIQKVNSLEAWLCPPRLIISNSSGKPDPKPIDLFS